MSVYEFHRTIVRRSLPWKSHDLWVAKIHEIEMRVNVFFPTKREPTFPILILPKLNSNVTHSKQSNSKAKKNEKKINSWNGTFTQHVNNALHDNITNGMEFDFLWQKLWYVNWFGVLASTASKCDETANANTFDMHH